jgi:hypothetical protein
VHASFWWQNQCLVASIGHCAQATSRGTADHPRHQHGSLHCTGQVLRRYNHLLQLRTGLCDLAGAACNTANMASHNAQSNISPKGIVWQVQAVAMCTSGAQPPSIKCWLSPDDPTGTKSLRAQLRHSLPVQVLACCPGQQQHTVQRGRHKAAGT